MNMNMEIKRISIASDGSVVFTSTDGHNLIGSDHIKGYRIPNKVIENAFDEFVDYINEEECLWEQEDSCSY